jgi:hypothetical protein
MSTDDSITLDDFLKTVGAKQMTAEEYYSAPPQHIFDDIQANARRIWASYTHPDYVEEKLARIDIPNVSDNAWYIVAMFDVSNQNKLLSMVEPETAAFIRRARGY